MLQVTLCIALAALIAWLALRANSPGDKRSGEPVLTEEALLHDKSSQASAQGGSCCQLYFFVPQRDTVVVCGVCQSVYQAVQKGDRGLLCHRGGEFLSFTRDGVLLNADTCGGLTLFEVYQAPLRPPHSDSK